MGARLTPPPPAVQPADAGSRAAGAADRRGALLLSLAAAVPIALLAGLVMFWQLGGFDERQPAATGPVPVAPPATTEPRCAELVAALPRSLARADARAVSGPAATAAAWGDPPIVLRCGVAEPRVEPTAELLIIEGVSWTTTETADAVVWTSTSLSVPVEVRVPSAYRAKAAAHVMNPLAEPLKTRLP